LRTHFEICTLEWKSLTYIHTVLNTESKYHLVRVEDNLSGVVFLFFCLFFFTLKFNTYLQNKYYTVGTVSQSIHKTVETRDKIDSLNTQMH